MIKSLKKMLGVLAFLWCGATAPVWSAQTAASQETLTFGVSSFGGEQLDPVVAKAELIYILSIMYDSLFDVDVATGKFKPGIVTDWEVSPDAKVWTLHLRDDVVFHDGTPFTAEDVKFTFEHAQSEDAQRGGFWRETLGEPPAIEILDPYTLKITTPSPQPHLAAFSTHVATPFMFVLPKKYIEENGIDAFRKHPIGTGPYKFVELVPGQEMVFQAVDYDHWRVNPAFKEVKIVEVPEETTRVAMLETGQIDATNVGLENAVRLEEQGYSVVGGEGTVANINFIGTYLPEAAGMPLADIRVREALSLAINRQELVDTILSGRGSAEVVNIALNWSTPDWTPELLAKWKPLLKEKYRYDPEEAKRLIAEAGFGDGFEFTFWVPPESSTPFMPDLMQAIAGYWAAVGAHVNLVQVDAAAWSAVRHTKNSMELVGGGGSNAQGPRNIAADSFKFFTSNYGNMNVLVGSPLEAKADELSVKAWTSIDPVESANAFDGLLDLTVNTWTSWPVVMSDKLVALGPRVVGDMSNDLLNPAYNFAYWKPADTAGN